MYPCIHVVTQLNLTFNYMFQSKTNLFMNVIKYGLSYNFNMLTKCRPNSIKTISNCTKTINNIHDEAYTKVISNICPSSFVGFGQADVMRGATRTHMTYMILQLVSLQIRVIYYSGTQSVEMCYIIINNISLF